MCANTNTNTTIVTTLCTEGPTLCRFSTSDAGGGWEIGKLEKIYRYVLPNFPTVLSPSGSALFGKLGNWEMITGTYFPISQFPKRPQPRWASTIWEIGKLGNGLRYILPNFPISQKTPAQMGQHDLGNWEMA